MQPTSSPDNNRPARGLGRRPRPVHRDAEAGAASGSPEEAATRSDEIEMFVQSLKPASEAIELDFPPAYGETAVAGTTTGEASTPGRPPVPFSPQASARGPGPGPGPSNDGPGPSGGAPGPSGGDGPGPAGGDGPGPTGGGEIAHGGPFGLRPAAPGDGGAPEEERDPDHSGRPGGEPEAIKPVESSRINPWDRDTGTFGGFGLGGRNGRFLFGGRNGADPRPGTNGHHATPVNGVSPVSPAVTDGTVPRGIAAEAEQAEPKPADPALGEPDPSAPVSAPSAAETPADGEARTAAGPDATAGPGATAADTAAGHDGTDSGETDPAEAERRDENGRDDMNGRTGIPGFPAAGDPAAGEEGVATDSPAPRGRRRDPSDPANPTANPTAKPTGSATGWASVPTTTHPVINPTSAAPISPGFPSYGQPPSYVPGLPDPSAGPVSGVPAPRAAGPVRPSSAPPVSPASGAPAPVLGDQPPAAPTSSASAVSGAPALSAAEEPAGFRPLGGGSGFSAGGFGGLRSGPGTVDVTFGEVPTPTSDSLRSIAEGLRGAGDSLRHAPEEHHTDDIEPRGIEPRGIEPRGIEPRGIEPRGAHAGADALPAEHPAAEPAAADDEPPSGPFQAAGPAQGAVLGSGMTAVPRFGATSGLRTAGEPGTRRAWEPEEPASRTPAPRRSASLEDAEPARRGEPATAEVSRGRRAAPEPELDQNDDGPMRPGDVAEEPIAFWDEDATRHFRAAWHEVKAEFVDDPVTALTRAHDLLTDAVNELTEALLAERDDLDPLRGTATPDTESMRMAMRGYREFLERILAL